MTCIAGVVGDDGRVYIGGDSAGVSGWSIRTRADAKVFKRGEWVFGFTESFRMGQLIRYQLTLPKPPERPREMDRWLATTFIDALRQTFKDGGYAIAKNEQEFGGTFLVGLRGRLYYVGSDYQVGECLHGFDAVGCGQDEARGALYALGQVSGTRGLCAPIHPRKRVLMALGATAAQNGGVCAPFKVVSA